MGTCTSTPRLGAKFFFGDRGSSAAFGFSPGSGFVCWVCWGFVGFVRFVRFVQFGFVGLRWVSSSNCRSGPLLGHTVPLET